MKYTHNAVQMCIASNEYDEKDYIRDYNIFQRKEMKPYDINSIHKILLWKKENIKSLLFCKTKDLYS